MNTKVLRRLANEQISRSMSIDEHGYAVINGLRSSADEIDRLTAENERLKANGFKAYLEIVARKHERQEDYRSTWAEKTCDSCKQKFIWDQGWLGDPTYPDVEAVKCCHCGAIEDLTSKDLPPLCRRPDDVSLEDVAEQTFPNPEALASERDALRKRVAELERLLIEVRAYLDSKSPREMRAFYAIKAALEGKP